MVSNPHALDSTEPSKCNLMSISYVCSKDIKDYNHFSDNDLMARRGGCQLHDNVEDRHEQEVKKAADEALAKAKAENPELSDVGIFCTSTSHAVDSTMNIPFSLSAT